jgi:hypothetical protein
MSVQERKYEPYTESPNSPRPKKAREVKSKFSSMYIIFCDIKEAVDEEFVLAGQIVNSAYYCNFYGNCMKLCEDFASSFEDKILAFAS